MKYVFIKAIELYRKIPFKCHQSCKFIPTCSEYALEAFHKYGTLKALWLTIRRLFRCNPWSKGGIDLLP